MDTSSKVGQYAPIVQLLLTEQQWPPQKSEDYQKIAITDKDNNHYQLLATGWITPNRYVDNLLIHIQIKPDGKVWLLENNTELRVAEELVARGVLRTDIVLGFHPPQYRALTGYAAA